MRFFSGSVPDSGARWNHCSVSFFLVLVLCSSRDVNSISKKLVLKTDLLVSAVLYSGGLGLIHTAASRGPAHELFFSKTATVVAVLSRS